ncbi:hypothetical protein BDR26DRAFT_915646 [Obelidium mucronatum]|nr:hypothetical protein BDR26DRAFT_915646 [Obelidium mucronatum]
MSLSYTRTQGVQSITIGEFTVSCAEDIEVSDKGLLTDRGIAMKAWPAANVLSEYFLWRFKQSLPSVRDGSNKKPFRMLELGAGTGLTSLFVGKAVIEALAAIQKQQQEHHHQQQLQQQQIEIYVSDLDIAVPLIAQNIGLNFDLNKESELGVRLKELDLNWTAHEETARWIKSLSPPFLKDAGGNIEDGLLPIDLVYASDVVYFPHLFDPLIQTLVLLARNGVNSPSTPSPTVEADATTAKAPAETPKHQQQPEIILTCRIRELSKEEPFYSKLGKYFHLRPLEDEEWDQGKFWRVYRGEYVMFRCVLRSVVLEGDGSEEFESLMQASMDTDIFD